MISVGRSYIRGHRFAFKPSQIKAACEKCVFGTGEHAEFCALRTHPADCDCELCVPAYLKDSSSLSLALPSAVENGQRVDGVRALKSGDRIEARIGKPAKWVDVIFDRLSSGGGIVFVTYGEFNIGLSLKHVRVPQSANAGSSQPANDSSEERQHKSMERSCT